MRSHLLVRHFLSQFIENEFSADLDRHQVLALAAAGLITVPLFITVFMGVKYLMQPLQAPGWTEITVLGDEMAFCAISILVSAIIATLEWDALALTERDAMILGVMPVPRREIVRAKIVSLVTFATAFVVAVNAVPAVLHPALMVANLPLNPVMLLPLMAAQGLATIAAGAFGFACVVALRELVYAMLGRRRFASFSGVLRSGLLFALLVSVALVPVRLSGRADWILESGAGPVLQRPVAWFAATHAAMAGRVLDRLPRPDLPRWRVDEEDRLRAQYRRSLPHLTALAIRSVVAVVLLVVVSGAMYLWNARQLHVLPEEEGGARTFRGFFRADVPAHVLARGSAKRAGLLFLVRTMVGSPAHRFYLISSTAAGVALLMAMPPTAMPIAGMPLRTYQLAVQTLTLTAIVAGFRAALRTSADPRATWVLGIADTGTGVAFRNGVRVGVIAATTTVVLLMVPLHAGAWGGSIALRHAINGVALGWLLVEVACASIEQPLVWTIPPSDGLNTVGAVFLGAIVILVFVMARIERAVLMTASGSFVFAGVIMALAVAIGRINARNQRAARPPLGTDFLVQ